jgi:hypothetical protein
MELKPTEQKIISDTFVIFAFIAYAGYLIQSVLVERVLYADGANFFVGLLSKEYAWPYFEDPKHLRLLVNVLNQLPVSIAIELGETSLRVLKLLFGAGAFFTPLALYGYALFLSKRANDFRVFFFATASLATSVIQSDIFILNQAITALAISWVIMHYLLLDLRVNVLDWAVIVTLSIIFLRSHESIIIWGGVFFIGAITIWILNEQELRYPRKSLVGFIGLVGVSGIIFAVFWLVRHPIIEQTYSYLSLFSLLSPGAIWQSNARIGLLVLVALFCLALLQGLGVSRAHQIYRTLNFFLLTVIGLSLLLIVLTGMLALANPELTNPSREYGYRFLVSFGSAFWMVLSVLVASKKITFPTSIAGLAKIIVSVGIISASLWQMSNNTQWAIFTSSTSAVLSNSSQVQLEPIEVRTHLNGLGAADAYKYRWPWAWPVLGVSLQETGTIDRIIAPESDEEYVQPPNLLPFVVFDGRGLIVFSDDFIEAWNTDK